jgi:hypothetical protein
MDQHTRDVLDLYQKGTNDKIEVLRQEVKDGFNETKDMHKLQQKDIQGLKKFKTRVIGFSSGVVAVIAFLADWIKLGVKHLKDFF